MAEPFTLPETPYASVAAFYDLEYQSVQEDIPLFLSLAKRTGGPILDLGTGTGRVAIPLAKAGYVVVGLEQSQTLLAYAQKKVRGAAARRLRLVHSDMRDFQVDHQFALAIAADNTFGHMISRADQERTLTCLHRHLATSGLLALVLQNPYQLVVEPPRNELALVWEGEGPGPGEYTSKSTALQLDLIEQTLSVRLWYDVLISDGTLRRYGTRLVFRWFFRPELELLLEHCGFKITEYYGSYQLDPYTGDSPLLIVIATKS